MRHDCISILRFNAKDDRKKNIIVSPENMFCRTPISNVLGKDSMQSLLGKAVKKVYTKGEVIFKPGDAANGIWVVGRGVLR